MPILLTLPMDSKVANWPRFVIKMNWECKSELHWFQCATLNPSVESVKWAKHQNFSFYFNKEVSCIKTRWCFHLCHIHFYINADFLTLRHDFQGEELYHLENTIVDMNKMLDKCVCLIKYYKSSSAWPGSFHDRLFVFSTCLAHWQDSFILFHQLLISLCSLLPTIATHIWPSNIFAWVIGDFYWVTTIHCNTHKHLYSEIKVKITHHFTTVSSV